MSEQNESTPKVIRELLDEERREHFKNGGICEVAINDARAGGGEVLDITIADGKVCALLAPFFQQVEGKWTSKGTARKPYPFNLEYTGAWREGEDLIVVDDTTRTVAVFRASLTHLLKKHREEKA